MLRVPLLFNLRTDPFERAPTTSNTYYDWVLDRVVPDRPVAEGRRRSSCRRSWQYPPRMKAASFTVDQVLAKMEAAMQGGH